MKKILSALIPFFLLHANISNAHPEVELKNAFLAKGVNHQPRTKYFNDDKSPKYTNHLILSDAPYLLQHAHNPINWYSWSEEALEKAKVENKLIFLSIGYSSCHWCHVMEEESFDDEEVAKIMNKDFVAIKVDREVNPDVDATFMKISQMTTGGGGWPLNVFLTPMGDAFLTDTYIPKSKLVSNLPQIAEIWSNDSKKILDMANQNIEMMKVIEESQKKSKGIALKKNISEVAVKNLLSTHDEMEG
ncbi:MAG: thioredoxin domain-containing protein, partial [Gammaproteobacteria bacterium]